MSSAGGFGGIYVKFLFLYTTAMFPIEPASELLPEGKPVLLLIRLGSRE